MCDWDNYETNPNTGMRCPQVLCVHHTMSLKRDALKNRQIIFQYFPGAGLSTVVMSFLLTTYYNVIMSWALFYLVSRSDVL